MLEVLFGGISFVLACGIQDCSGRQGHVPWSPLPFYGLHRGVVAGVKLLPKQMRTVALFVYPGLSMMVAAP